MGTDDFNSFANETSTSIPTAQEHPAEKPLEPPKSVCEVGPCKNLLKYQMSLKGGDILVTRRKCLLGVDFSVVPQTPMNLPIAIQSLVSFENMPLVCSQHTPWNEEELVDFADRQMQAADREAALRAAEASRDKPDSPPPLNAVYDDNDVDNMPEISVPTLPEKF